jgi:hypothetical protein
MVDNGEADPPSVYAASNFSKVRCDATAIAAATTIGSTAAVRDPKDIVVHDEGTTYSTEMRQAVKDDVTKFGPGNFSAIYKRYPVFVGSPRDIVRVRYFTLYDFLCESVYICALPPT